MTSTSLYRSYKGLGCAEDRCSAERNSTMKESDARRLWGAVGVLSEACLSLVSARVGGGDRGICVEENGPVS